MTSPLSQDTTMSGTEGIIKRPIVEYTASPHELTPGAGSFSESKVQYFPSKDQYKLNEQAAIGSLQIVDNKSQSIEQSFQDKSERERVSKYDEDELDSVEMDPMEQHELYYQEF